jgi:MFS transporter
VRRVTPIAARLRSGTQRYRALLALREARRPLFASIAGSMPIGMFTLAILLLVRETSGSFATAGRVVGAFAVANALGAVAQGRLMDRLGQPRVLRAAAAGHVVALGALVVAGERGAPAGVLAVCAFAGGACLPQVPAAMRSLWTALVTEPEQRHTAYALVTIVFELSVVTAPVLVAGIVIVASPAAAVIVAAALGAGGAFGFSATAASRRWRGAPRTAGPLGPLAGAGMRTVSAVLLAFGTAIGVLQVAMPAFAAGRGSAAAGGLLLAALSAGSLCGGVAYGARDWPGAPAQRLVGLLLGIGAGCATLAAVRAPVAVVAALLGIGVMLAPTAVVCSGLLDVVAPPGTVTEAFGVTVMAIVAGTAVGNALGGALVDAATYRTACLAAAGVAAAGAVSAHVWRATLRVR